MKNIIKIITDNLILLVGVIFFTYNFFKFIIIIINPSRSYPIPDLPSVLIYLTVSVVLIVLGMLIIKK